MIYVASPYTHADREVRIQRFEAVSKFAAEHLKEGRKIYSPIAYGHPIAEKHELPKDFHFWLDLDLDMLRRADACWVLMLDGWQESRGVREEVAFALLHRIPVKYFDPNYEHNSYPGTTQG